MTTGGAAGVSRTPAPPADLDSEMPVSDADPVEASEARRERELSGSGLPGSNSAC
jgi:hypothetical protein